VARGDGSAPRLIEVRLDPVGPGEVLVELHASAVCRTELLTVDPPPAAGDAAEPAGADEVDDAGGWDAAGGASGGRLTVLGHAATGEVVEVGPGVGRLRPGDRVVVVGTHQCGECFYCRNAAPGACEKIFEHMERRVGETAGGEVVWGDGGIGTHAERLVYPQSNLVRVEGAVPPEQLALLGCGVTSGLGSVLEVAGVRPGQSVAVSGCGHLGLWMVQAARFAGATTVIAIDPEPWRRERALELGATHTLDGSGDVPAAVRALTAGRGADVGLEAAGTTLAMRQSFEATRYGGVVVPTGLESLTAEVTLSNLQYALSSRTIVGSQCGGGDVRRIVPAYEALLARGTLRPDAIITARYPLDAAADAYPALRDPHQLTGVILMPTAPTPTPTPTTGVPTTEPPATQTPEETP
jgi:S-(hydroxymethyl)glutathione dehydrogenase/alcohol dehydrogenase